jgi:hypothetical protein
VRTSRIPSEIWGVDNHLNPLMYNAILLHPSTHLILHGQMGGQRLSAECGKGKLLHGTVNPINNTHRTWPLHLVHQCTIRG